jgi:hypothetical protein
MFKPKIGKRYYFVRRMGETIERVEFTRHEDGSAGWWSEREEATFEEDPHAWKLALAQLAVEGFVLEEPQSSCNRS